MQKIDRTHNRPNFEKLNSQSLRSLSQPQDSSVLLRTQDPCPRAPHLGTLGTLDSPHCKVRFGQMEIISLIDTGAEISVLRKDVYTQLPSQLVKKQEASTVEYCLGPDGSALYPFCTATVRLKLNGYVFTHTFIVLETLKKSMILGSDFLCKENARIVFAYEKPYCLLLASRMKIPLFALGPQNPDVSAISRLPKKLPFTPKMWNDNSYQSKQLSECSTELDDGSNAKSVRRDIYDEPKKFSAHVSTSFRKQNRPSQLALNRRPSHKSPLKLKPVKNGYQPRSNAQSLRHRPAEPKAPGTDQNSHRMFRIRSNEHRNASLDFKGNRSNNMASLARAKNTTTQDRMPKKIKARAKRHQPTQRSKQPSLPSKESLLLQNQNNWNTTSYTLPTANRFSVLEQGDLSDLSPIQKNGSQFENQLKNSKYSVARREQQRAKEKRKRHRKTEMKEQQNNLEQLGFYEEEPANTENNSPQGVQGTLPRKRKKRHTPKVAHSPWDNSQMNDLENSQSRNTTSKSYADAVKTSLMAKAHCNEDGDSYLLVPSIMIKKPQLVVKDRNHPSLENQQNLQNTRKTNNYIKPLMGEEWMARWRKAQLEKNRCRNKPTQIQTSNYQEGLKPRSNGSDNCGNSTAHNNERKPPRFIDLDPQWKDRHHLTEQMKMGISPNQSRTYYEQYSDEMSDEDDEIIWPLPRKNNPSPLPSKKSWSDKPLIEKDNPSPLPSKKSRSEKPLIRKNTPSPSTSRKSWNDGVHQMETILEENKDIQLITSPAVSAVQYKPGFHADELKTNQNYCPLPPLVWDEEDMETDVPQPMESAPSSGGIRQNTPTPLPDSVEEKIAGVVPDIGTEDSYTRAKLLEVLRQNEHLFAPTDLELGQTNLMEFGIETGDHPPIKQKAYSTPWSQKDIIREHVDSMLAAGVIVPSASPWASPVLLVDKPKDTKRAGKPIYRFCVDYRRLNSVTKKNSHPLPNITEVIDGLGGAKIFSSLDLKSGYWQIPLKPEDMEKTAFTTGDALYEFTRVPFGLANAPSAFANLIGAVLNGLQFKFCLAYLDDIIVYSSTIEEHIEHLQIVFKRLEQAGLKLKPSKCSYICKQLDFLGHVISADGVQVCPDKVKAITQLDPPVDQKSVRAFLGMCSYYRKYIRDMGTIAKPLTELTRKNHKFQWTEECQKAFDTLKHALSTAPVLAYPNRSEDHPFVLYTDGSLVAIGAILAQQDPEGNERVVQYFSSVLPESMKNYSVSEIECYAIVRALTKFRNYLMGRRFKCYTDHSPLVTIQKTKLNNRRLQRWAAALTEFDMEIIYKPGKMQKADFLSRIPHSGPPVLEDPDLDAENKYLPEISAILCESDYLSPLQYVGLNLCDQCRETIPSTFEEENMWKEETFYHMIQEDYQPPVKLCEECIWMLQQEDPVVDLTSTAISPPSSPELEYDMEMEYLARPSPHAAWRYPNEDFIETPAYPRNRIQDMYTLTYPPDPLFSSDSSDNEDYQKISNHAPVGSSCQSLNPTPLKNPTQPQLNIIDIGNPDWNEMEEITEYSVPDNPELTGPPPEDIAKEQKEDNEIQELMELVESDVGPKNYLVQDGILYHLAPPIRPDPEPRIQIVVPKKMIGKILKAYHEPYHWGIHKNYAILHQRFYWKSMYADCVKHVQRCLPCAKTKLKKSRAPLRNQRPLPAHPFAEVMVDTVGKLPETPEGYKYIVTFIDIFSGWVEAFPAKDKSAESVARIIATELIPRHSTPPVLRSDNGTEYINELLDQLSVNLGINRISCLPYSPWSQGPIERFNQTLKHGLKRRLGEKHTDWILHLPAVLFACRVAPQERHGLSPFSVLYGREPYLLADEMFAPKLTYKGGSWSKNQIQRMNQAFALVKNRTQETRRKQKEFYDRRIDPIQLTEGAHVWYYDSTNIRGPSKFHSHWKPMYKVIRFKSPEAVVIQHQPTGKQKCVHRNHLRPVYPSQAWDANYGNQRKPVADRVMPSRKLRERELQAEEDETMFLEDDMEPDEHVVRQWISSTPVPPPPSRQNSLADETESRAITPSPDQDVTAVSPQMSTDNATPEPRISTEEVNMDTDPPMETESTNMEQEQTGNNIPVPKSPTPPPQRPYNLRPREEPSQDDEKENEPTVPTRTSTPPPPLPPRSPITPTSRSKFPYNLRRRRTPPPIPTTPNGTPLPPWYPEHAATEPSSRHETVTPSSSITSLPPDTSTPPPASDEDEPQTGIVIGNPYNRPIIPKRTRERPAETRELDAPASRTRSQTNARCMKRNRSDSSVEDELIPTKKVHVQSSNQTDSNPARWKYPPQVEGETSEVTFAKQEEVPDQSQAPADNPDNPNSDGTGITDDNNPSEMEIDMIKKSRSRTADGNQKKIKWFPLKNFKPFQQKKKEK